MSRLTIYSDNDTRATETFTDGAEIGRRLGAIGVRFERWEAARTLADDATQDDVLEAYRAQVDALMTEYGFKSVDVVSLNPDHPDKAALRAKFLDEHTHSDFEVRFFVDGKGLFYIHTGGKVYGVLCEKGDLISVPANTPHWFDMGENPRFKCIRLFTTPEGWVAQFTGDKIAAGYPPFC
ncbi:MAG: acireductone dioxygenase [Gammaproteobacteria bacterium]|jgi:1,2-dihydroxy-3-keto-5-methylthiopentene dioxygenase|nr:acireductone dioxygenase [Gammaproteobacteria bacterium]